MISMLRRFARKDIKAAIKWANDGNQALHVWLRDMSFSQDAPRCFQKARVWAHLMDNDAQRLIATARRFGVNSIRVMDKRIDGRQHIDLCGKPLERAIEECEQ